MHVDVSQGPHHNWDLTLMSELRLMMINMMKLGIMMTTMNMKIMKKMNDE